jgi:hypothetical protein
MRNSGDFLQTRCGGTIGQTTRRWVLDVLDEIAQGRSSMVAKRHPLGFVCFPLERQGHQGVCMHVWSDGLPRAAPTTSPVHSHSWDLISYVLYGSVRNEIFDVTDAPEQATYRLFEIRSDEEIDQICATSRLVRCELAAAEVSHGGDSYTVPAGIFHATVIRGEAATVAFGSSQPGRMDLSLGGIGTRTHRIRRQRCDRDETASVARMVVQQLADQEDS